MKHLILIALGSNVARENLLRCRQLMEEYLTISKASDIIMTDPIGMKSGKFHNQLLAGTTDVTLDELTRLTKDTETRLGRQRGIGVVSIDIDIMQYDDIRLHEADWERDYIQQLYCQIQK